MYRPPIAAITSTLSAAGLDAVLELDEFAHVERDGVEEMLAAYGKFVAEVIAPSDRAGDRFGVVFEPTSGTVEVAPEVRTAFESWVAGGWCGLGASAAHGGGGLPSLVALAAEEMLASANLALSLNPMLTQGAIHVLERRATEEQKARYLRPLVAGQWTGTMNLTEPQAGSDVGAITTRATEMGDGTWRIDGQKIFITWGDHELTENIVHLVLARTEGAASGTRGLSLFVVPKRRVDSDGAPAERNGVCCIGIEHKLGIHSSPTCTLEFRGAIGELIGEVGEGMSHMFVMMNAARLSVGLEGLAVSERAYQQALQYALERVQGRGPGSSAPSPIIEHPDVNRTLMLMSSSVDAMRMLLYSTAAAIDRARFHTNPDERSSSLARADLLTPLAKAWCTDEGVSNASHAIQVLGGAGFIEESGVAQRYRDARIAPIYEGTNGIQAIDLALRKVRRDRGQALGDLVAELRILLEAIAPLSVVASDTALLASEALDAVCEAAAWLISADEVDALASATAFLDLVASTVAGCLLVAPILKVHQSGDGENARLAIARWRFFVLQRLAGAASSVRSITTTAELSTSLLRL
ncbi:MAG: acyl-CoA dehydrogenase family protein [Actinomycetota bacterium]|nr:acyl-CoA dehydrogenase family protein [Actinomycetota bacterium]